MARITAKITAFLIKNELEIGNPPWKPMKGIMPASDFTKSSSMLESHKKYNHRHYQILDDEQKAGLLMEKDSFHNFWEHEEKTSTADIQMMFFNKTEQGMKTEMTNAKCNKTTNILKGKIKTPIVCNDKHLNGMIELSDSAGIVAAKVGCSSENKNFLLDGFVKEKHICTRSLTKEYYLSACMDDCLLVGLDLLNIVKLETLNQKNRRKACAGQAKSNILNSSIFEKHEE